MDSLVLLPSALLLLLSAIGLYLGRKKNIRVQPKEMVVLITGGAHGIGLCLAEKLLQMGFRVIILDINVPDTSTVLTENLKRLKFIVCDVGNQEMVFNAITNLEWMPTMLVNNAGIHNQGKRLDQLGASEIRRIVDTNLMGVLWTTKYLLPSMIRAQFGHIINVSSCLGLAGLNNMTDYCATKFAVYGFNESLRLELKASGYKNIKTTVVCPFLVKTGMFDGLRIAHPWLTRPLSTEEVALNILDAILYRDTEEIWLPKRLWLLPLFRFLPCWVYDFTQQVASQGIINAFTVFRYWDHAAVLYIMINLMLNDLLLLVKVQIDRRRFGTLSYCSPVNCSEKRTNFNS